MEASPRARLQGLWPDKEGYSSERKRTLNDEARPPERLRIHIGKKDETSGFFPCCGQLLRAIPFWMAQGSLPVQIKMDLRIGIT